MGIEISLGLRRTLQAIDSGLAVVVLLFIVVGIVQDGDRVRPSPGRKRFAA